jgi:NAD(P)-dependent dehydrogenase (short-subunit alcohol dehydrogenase family)
MPANPKSTVLITGVSTGIGLGMAQRFLSSGHRVIGSVRSADTAARLREQLGAGFSPLVFDVCRQDEIDRAEVELQGLLPDGHLDALINNAGSAGMGPLLHIAPEVLQQHLDTLVVGQLRVTQKFFHYLVTPGFPPGRIINISSISGTGASPFFGAYVAAKHALEGLSKTLREELRPYGVAVIVMAPGNIATEIWPKQQDGQIEAFAGTSFYPALRKRLEWIRTDAVPNAMTVQEFADVLYGIFTDPTPADRYTVIKAKKPRIPWSRRQARAIPG